MSGYRNRRLNEEILRELSDILRTVKDPRVAGCFVSLTAAECSGDMKHCKVYYSVMSEHRDGDCGKGLSNAAGYFRSLLAERLNLRTTPELVFIRDNSAEYGAHISELITKLRSENLMGNETGDDTAGSDEE
ncbi:MAG: 30S ribosome-binding factor RbfA [Clostridia bacterium]|nr:30S ribosome-binding factor RbfA [Clostridia bacterium]